MFAGDKHHAVRVNDEITIDVMPGVAGNRWETLRPPKDQMAAAAITAAIAALSKKWKSGQKRVARRASTSKTPTAPANSRARLPPWKATSGVRGSGLQNRRALHLSNTATETRRAVADLRVVLIRSSSCMVCAVKYDSWQLGQVTLGMPSTTSSVRPRPKLRVTSRSCAPGRPHDSQRSVDAVNRDDAEPSSPVDLDDRFGLLPIERAAADDTLDFARRPVALVRDNRACEDDIFEVEDCEVFIGKFGNGVGRQSIAQRLDQSAQLSDGRPGHSVYPRSGPKRLASRVLRLSLKASFPPIPRRNTPRPLNALPPPPQPLSIRVR